MCLTEQKQMEMVSDKLSVFTFKRLSCYKSSEDHMCTLFRFIFNN